MTHVRLGALVALVILLDAGCRLPQSPKQTRKLIVLGIDGMDPTFVARHWTDLPNLNQLRERGSFHRLGTTFPPQSPVAWSSFTTGLEPAEHGIYDFVERDPTDIAPYSSMSKMEEPRWKLKLGSYVLPLSKPRIVSMRRGEPFWQRLARKGITSTVIRMPDNYPPVEAGNALSGMGTPDLRGTLGTFSYYTDNPEETSHSVSGGRIVKTDLVEGHLQLSIEGPPNTLREEQAFTSVNLTVDVDPINPVARFSLPDQAVILKQGEWSSWMSVNFPLIPHLVGVRGMFRLFVKQLHPQFQLYVSPINIDPQSPALPISNPPRWSGQIVQEVGLFSTLGIPEDTSAYRQNVFNLSEFRRQAQLVLDDEKTLLRYSLQHFRSGLLFFYFSSVDQNSHVLWGKHDPELLEVYRQVDKSVGEVMNAFPSVNLIILSDHGFSRFDRAVHLNAWLRDRGFLTLKGAAGDNTSLSSMDWEATEAYAVGLNGLYLNRKGRESHGIVSSGLQAQSLIAQLREQLLAWRDPLNGKPVVKSIYEEHPAPQNVNSAPDLIVGYSPGYRASWETALGETPAIEIEDNSDAWIADHCINPEDVPGVLFTTLPIQTKNPRLEDVTKLILQFFNQPAFPK